MEEKNFYINFNGYVTVPAKDGNEAYNIFWEKVHKVFGEDIWGRNHIEVESIEEEW